MLFAGVTNLNHMMDTVTKNFLTFEKIKTLIKSNNFIRYYTLISNIPTDIKKCLKDNIDNINTENFHPKDDFLERLINAKSLKIVYITLLKTLTHLPIKKERKYQRTIKK
jgi:flagellar basal body rod protein FlgB